MNSDEDRKIVIENSMFEKYNRIFSEYIEKCNIFDCEIINLDNAKKYLMLYFLYEYSDKIQFIIDNPQYPSMLNYVKTGLLTEKEMIQVLLDK